MSVTSSQPAVWKVCVAIELTSEVGAVLLWEVATPLVTWLECCTPGCYIAAHQDVILLHTRMLYTAIFQIWHIQNAKTYSLYIYIPIILYVGSATGIQGAIWGCTSSKSGRQITACPARWGDSIATVNFTCYCSMHEHCLNFGTKNTIVIVVRLGNHVILLAA